MDHATLEWLLQRLEKLGPGEAPPPALLDVIREAVTFALEVSEKRGPGRPSKVEGEARWTAWKIARGHDPEPTIAAAIASQTYSPQDQETFRRKVSTMLAVQGRQLPKRKPGRKPGNRHLIRE